MAVRAPDEACFECEVSLPVVKSVVWSLNGEPLQPSSQVSLERMGAVHRLTLRHTSLNMSGQVEFTSGQATSRAQLQVRQRSGFVALAFTNIIRCISGNVRFAA